MRTKKWIYLILVFVVTMGFATPISADVHECLDAHGALVEAWGTDFTRNYLGAIELLDKFYVSLPQNRLGETLYPDYFGGVYINDYGNLVILVVESHSLADASAFTRSLYEGGGIIKEVEFAYNDLRNAFEFLSDFIPNTPDSLPASNVDGVMLDIVNNEVLVSLAVYTEEKIDLFVDMVFDAPFLRFHPSPGLPEATFEYDYSTEIPHYPYEQVTAAMTHTVRPGDSLFLRNQFGNLLHVGSVGYMARMDWQWQSRMGFVTAAHIGLSGTLRTGDHLYNSSGMVIGIVREVRHHTVDVAFVEITNALGSQSVAFGGLGRNDASNIVGNRVFLDGASGRGRQGTIMTAWGGWTSSGNWVDGFMVSTTTQRNDSGGLVYSWTSAVNNGMNGILVAGWEGRESVFTTVSMHRSFLGGGLRFP
ncbi:MAG: S1 family peptidase [Defluviitaleaceae bacterium]|nr:S1 family peptidase [Defluviitaleaceae bacterium]